MICVLTGLAIIFFSVLWNVEVRRVTFLYSRTIKNSVLWGLVISIPVCCFLIRKGREKIKKPVDYIKLYIAASVLSVIVALIAATTMTYYIPGIYSSYTKHYRYSERTGKGGCSGARVKDPELGEIKICYPAGNYPSDSYIYVEKRSNALGSVVTYASTLP